MMKRLFFLLTALLTLSVGMWAQTQSVTYIDENGVEQTVTATVITNSTTTLNAGWYVVTGTDVQTGSLTCNGEVYLILADGAKLSVAGGDYQAGIQVSGEDNFLSIYGQAAQSGRLIATGGDEGSGIGGGERGSGSNITINGGMVWATGGCDAAGIGGGFDGSGSNITIYGGRVTATGGISAAGIGGGMYGSGSNITIYGGTVVATGGEDGSGIGGGFDSSGSDIIMPVNYRIKADGTFIHNDNDGTDLADSLAGKQNVEAYPDGFLNERNAAFAAISAAVEGIADEAILAMAAAGMEDVFQAEGSGDIEASKQKALDDLQYVISIYNSGKAAGKTEAAAELLGSMGEPCTDCPSVEVTKGTKTVKLYNPESVKFKKE